jgi:hypothetical protein
VKGGVEVDPGDDAVPRPGGEAHAVMPRRGGSGRGGWCRLGRPARATGARRSPGWACAPSGAAPCTTARSASGTPRAPAPPAWPLDRRGPSPARGMPRTRRPGRAAPSRSNEKPRAGRATGLRRRAGAGRPLGSCGQAGVVLHARGSPRT